MTPTLIVLVLLVIGVGIVVWATRRKPAPPPAARTDQDTAWNDPLTPGAPARPVDPATAPWIAPDEALPQHQGVLWRKRHFPGIVPHVQVNSILSVAEGIAAGLGVGVLPLFLARDRSDLVALTEPLADAETQLWLLTHPESRHLRRIATVAQHLAGNISLPG